MKERLTGGTAVFCITAMRSSRNRRVGVNVALKDSKSKRPPSACTLAFHIFFE
jgi:hypothetical protein